MIGARTRVDIGGSGLSVIFGPQFRTSDEARMFVTTATDVGGFFAFLSTATLWFGLR